MILDTITKLTEYFGNEKLIVDDERCLNARFKKAGCHICVEKCPVEAINLDGRQVRLDPDKCSHCGACVWQCPTEVFTQPQLNASKLTQTLFAIQDETVELRCPQNKNDAKAIHNAMVVLYPQCLAGLPASTLIELARGRSLFLNDDQCAQCPLSKAHSSIVYSVNRANHWMGAFGVRQKIFLLSSSEGSTLEKIHPARVLDSVHPPTGRREFFGYLKRVLVDAGVDAVNHLQMNDEPKMADHQHWLIHLPRERQNLVAALGKLGRPPENAAMQLPRVMVEVERCTACGLCAKFCPSGALRFNTEGNRFVLDYIPLACVDCKLCVMACPTQAVTLEHDMGLGRFIRPDPSLLIEGDLVPCVVCKKPTAAHADHEARCEVCQTLMDRQAQSKAFCASLFPTDAHQS